MFLKKRKQFPSIAKIIQLQAFWQLPLKQITLLFVVTLCAAVTLTWFAFSASRVVIYLSGDSWHGHSFHKVFSLTLDLEFINSSFVVVVIQRDVSFHSVTLLWLHKDVCHLTDHSNGDACVT